MTVKSLLALGALSTIAVASSAWAQAPAPAAAAAVGGPPITGVCTYFQDAALVNSSAGKSVTERMKQLVAVVQAELSPEAKAIEDERTALQAMTHEQIQQPLNAKRVETLQQKYMGFQRKEEIRSKELEATKNKEFGLIANESIPIVNQIVTENHCGVVLERSQLVWANPQMDITETVVQRLNTKLPAVPAFERLNAEQQQGGAAPAAAAPAATSTAKKKSK